MQDFRYTFLLKVKNNLLQLFLFYEGNNNVSMNLFYGYKNVLFLKLGKNFINSNGCFPFHVCVCLSVPDPLLTIHFTPSHLPPGYLFAYYTTFSGQPISKRKKERTLGF